MVFRPKKLTYSPHELDRIQVVPETRLGIEEFAVLVNEDLAEVRDAGVGDANHVSDDNYEVIHWISPWRCRLSRL